MNKRRVLFVYDDMLGFVDEKGFHYEKHLFEALRCVRRAGELEIVRVGNETLPSLFYETLAGEDIYFDSEVKEISLDNVDTDNSYQVSKSKDCALKNFDSYSSLLEFFLPEETIKHRCYSVERNTRETQIYLSLDLDGSGKGELKTGVGFFDHMLEQVIKHSRCDINGIIKGDLEVDEHHTVEDLGITLGQAFRYALGDKRGINRYGHDILMMDDVLATVAVDFSGRPYLIWKVNFKRQEVGGFPTEMFEHFFKSFSDAAQCNLSIEVTDGNTHHQAEAAFKAFARAIRMAVKRVPGSKELPSTKGVL
ncbi:MAG: imidazoleglycerol-phosphate dehydratase HisB [Sphaerochaetaceae bacterium]|nr:imidazoleglycerol-phosphate dehydratase HisB [Sphaerochaetaceae bacterium]